MTLYYVLPPREDESDDAHEWGSDEKGDGSFEKPWATYRYAFEQVFAIGSGTTGDLIISPESDVNNENTT